MAEFIRLKNDPAGRRLPVESWRALSDTQAADRPVQEWQLLTQPSQPRLAVRIAGWCAIIILPLVAIEAAAALYYTARDGRYISVRTRLAETSNAFVNAFNSDPAADISTRSTPIRFWRTSTNTTRRIHAASDRTQSDFSVENFH
jgi:hypothetical protein